jgi:hypothetical protein
MIFFILYYFLKRTFEDAQLKARVGNILPKTAALRIT